jgi:hypothetical protein
MSDVAISELPLHAFDRSLAERRLPAAHVVAAKAIDIGARYGVALLMMGGGAIAAVAIAWQG